MDKIQMLMISFVFIATSGDEFWKISHYYCDLVLLRITQGFRILIHC